MANKELTEANLEIARAAKSDSGAMKTISIMTMLFLPATYFAALFSVPTLQWDKQDITGNRFWVYWAFTIPTTVCVFIVWAVSVYLPSFKRNRASAGSSPHVTDRVGVKRAPGP